ncbi:hypothetical protein RCL_jg13076.t1 [Rhizophagus clarus]|uniref:Uncharacterized protein n=1 Tax=Rhizophagus clarus TaxID=94130 RepID=A0A8H3KVI4_9GLOM|nr:hypothetical protein RCL_jg13076.t1 [Rhizophagus clarus]
MWSDDICYPFKYPSVNSYNIFGEWKKDYKFWVSIDIGLNEGVGKPEKNNSRKVPISRVIPDFFLAAWFLFSYCGSILKYFFFVI